APGPLPDRGRSGHGQVREAEARRGEGQLAGSRDEQGGRQEQPVLLPQLPLLRLRQRAHRAGRQGKGKGQEEAEEVVKLVNQIPCLNEEATLPVTVASLPRSVAGVQEVEILVVGDGSTAQSA